MTRSHFEFIADKVAPLMGWPSSIVALADELSATNPNFNKAKFISRATTAWENAEHNQQFMNAKIDDEIPY